MYLKRVGAWFAAHGVTVSHFRCFTHVPQTEGGLPLPSSPCAKPPEALRWAIDDHGPGWVSECEKTQASLMRYREALLTFHRESKRARYSKKKAAASQRPRAL